LPSGWHSWLPSSIRRLLKSSCSPLSPGISMTPSAARLPLRGPGPLMRLGDF
jgi:hypothetical protein